MDFNNNEEAKNEKKGENITVTTSDVAKQTHKINITRVEMSKYFNAPQTLAARLLGVSVSTLKRRYYEMYKGRWPYQSLSNKERKKTIWFYVNEEEYSEKFISKETITILNKAFNDCTKSPSEYTLSSIQGNNTTNGSKQKEIMFLSYIPQHEREDLKLSVGKGEIIVGGSKQKYKKPSKSKN
ncbi:hypothetical protein ABK040_013382 [Willaertia magna]